MSALRPVCREEREWRSCCDWEYSDPNDPLDLEDASARCNPVDARETPEIIDTLSPRSSLSTDILGRLSRGAGRLKTLDMTVETVDREVLRMEAGREEEKKRFEVDGGRMLWDVEPRKSCQYSQARQ